MITDTSKKERAEQLSTATAPSQQQRGKSLIKLAVKMVEESSTKVDPSLAEVREGEELEQKMCSLRNNVILAELGTIARQFALNEPERDKKRLIDDIRGVIEEAFPQEPSEKPLEGEIGMERSMFAELGAIMAEDILKVYHYLASYVFSPSDTRQTKSSPVSASEYFGYIREYWGEFIFYVKEKVGSIYHIIRQKAEQQKSNVSDEPKTESNNSLSLREVVRSSWDELKDDATVGLGFLYKITKEKLPLSKITLLTSSSLREAESNPNQIDNKNPDISYISKKNEPTGTIIHNAYIGSLKNEDSELDSRNLPPTAELTTDMVKDAIVKKTHGNLMIQKNDDDVDVDVNGIPDEKYKIARVFVVVTLIVIFLIIVSNQ